MASVFERAGGGRAAGSVPEPGTAISDGGAAPASELRAGVVGAGVFGSYHAAKYAALEAEGVRLTAVFDPDPARAAALAGKYGAAPCLDVDALLDNVDIVTIASPAASHGQLALAALDAGRHCLVEKPIALSRIEAAAMIALARERDLVLQVGHQERFAAMAAGLFGAARDAVRVECRRLCAQSGRGEDVSATLDLMIHDLDLVGALGWGEPTAVDAAGTDHEVHAELRFAGGRSAHLWASRRAAEAERGFAFVTGRGVGRFDFVTRRYEGPAAAAALDPGAPVLSNEARAAALTDPLGYSVAAFAARVRDRKVVAPTGENGAAALDWALLIDEARRSGPRPIAPSPQLFQGAVA